MTETRFPITRAAVRLGFLSGAWAGALESSLGVALEVRLKGMYLGPGAELSEVLRRLVDPWVVPRAVLLYAALGFVICGALGLARDLFDRIVPATRTGHTPTVRAAALLGGALALLVMQYLLIRRGWPGAAWPPERLHAAQAPALLSSLLMAWCLGRALGAVVDRARRSPRAASIARASVRGSVWVLGGLASAALGVALWGRDPSSKLPSSRTTPAPPAGRRPDVVLLVLDTARADRFSTFGAARRTSPFLSELGGLGAIYEHASSTAPWTLPSHGTLFTGELAHRHGADWGPMRLRPEMRTLAEVFRDAGYATAAFTNNPWIGPVAGLDRGFQELHPLWRAHGGTWDRLLAVRVARRLSGRDPDEGARDTLVELSQWLKRAPDRPLFLFVNWMELHDPNWPQRGAERFLPRGTTRAQLRGLNQNPYRWLAHRASMNGADFELLGDLYDAQIAYLDDRIRELWNLLTDTRGVDNLVLAVVGDHGENLGDHGLLSHVFSLHESLLHVPLVLVAPGRVAAHQRVTTPVSLVDVAPTLEGLAGVGPAGAPGRRGRSLLSDPPEGRADSVILAEHPPPGPILDILRANDPALDLAPFDRSWLVAREGRWKLVAHGDGAVELFDLERDPSELHDVAEAEPALVARLRAALVEPASVVPPNRSSAPGPQASEGAIDAETLERLRALGYNV